MKPPLKNAALPIWRCHKLVAAAEIAAIRLHPDGSGTLFPANPDITPIEVDERYVAKHAPRAGGYYVLYGDGYASFSPAEAFESGYTRIG